MENKVEWPVLSKEQVQTIRTQVWVNIVNEVQLEQMMLGLIGQVMQRMPGDTWVVQMSTEHLNWLRRFHQANQRAKIYKGGKFPELLGVPIHIREDLTEPRLRDELSHGVVLP